MGPCETVSAQLRELPAEQAAYTMGEKSHQPHFRQEADIQNLYRITGRQFQGNQTTYQRWAAAELKRQFLEEREEEDLWTGRQTDRWPITAFKRSISLVKEMQVKTSLRYHLTQSGIKKPQVWV